MRHVAVIGLLVACSGNGTGQVTADGNLADADVAELEHGLRGEYFARYHDRVLDRVDPAIDFSWGDGELVPGSGADRVSVRWTGYLEVPEAATYTFVTSNDDGVRVTIGDTVVIDDWRFHFPERHEGTIELAAGTVPIVVEYFEVDLTAEMRLSWSAPAIGLEEQIIPTEHLRAPPAPTDLPSVKPPYANPVVDRDCPDPGVAFADDAFYMVCTGGKFPIQRSPDLVLWEPTGTAILPGGKAPWSVNGGRNWAPEIHRVGNHYVAYFTAVNGANVLSIGAASATSIEGPYTDRGGPLVEHPQGVIDASFFRDSDGTNYLLYKIDGNSVGQPTPIYIRKLAADGLSFAAGSTQTELIRNAPATWEGGVVEAPWLVKRDGTYYLFYSGNVYDHRYRTGVARATSVTGPYTKRAMPILANNARWVGPGHGSVVSIGDALYFVYHAWAANAQGTAGPGGRRVLVDKIEWGSDGWPKIANGTPSTTLQRWPGE
ncbi:MAG: family 43 glycosylhydrolase [Kofleriaceae bacterium]|nr:family 43 glycosylhydrolase [Kofleriaceae bacterium]